jgi:hypothetical protein
MAKEFKIISETNLNLLESSVNIYIHLGYVPVGTVFKDDRNFYCISLYRDDHDI